MSKMPSGNTPNWSIFTVAELQRILFQEEIDFNPNEVRRKPHLVKLCKDVFSEEDFDRYYNRLRNKEDEPASSTSSPPEPVVEPRVTRRKSLPDALRTCVPADVVPEKSKNVRRKSAAKSRVRPSVEASADARSEFIRKRREILALLDSSSSEEEVEPMEEEKAPPHRKQESVEVPPISSPGNKPADRNGRSLLWRRPSERGTATTSGVKVAFAETPEIVMTEEVHHETPKTPPHTIPVRRSSADGRRQMCPMESTPMELENTMEVYRTIRGEGETVPRRRSRDGEAKDRTHPSKPRKSNKTKEDVTFDDSTFGDPQFLPRRSPVKTKVSTRSAVDLRWGDLHHFHQDEEHQGERENLRPALTKTQSYSSNDTASNRATGCRSCSSEEQVSQRANLFEPILYRQPKDKAAGPSVGSPSYHLQGDMSQPLIEIPPKQPQFQVCGSSVSEDIPPARRHHNGIPSALHDRKDHITADGNRQTRADIRSRNDATKRLTSDSARVRWNIVGEEFQDVPPKKHPSASLLEQAADTGRTDTRRSDRGRSSRAAQPSRTAYRETHRDYKVMDDKLFSPRGDQDGKQFSASMNERFEKCSRRSESLTRKQVLRMSIDAAEQQKERSLSSDSEMVFFTAEPDQSILPDLASVRHLQDIAADSTETNEAEASKSFFESLKDAIYYCYGKQQVSEVVPEIDTTRQSSAWSLKSIMIMLFTAAVIPLAVFVRVKGMIPLEERFCPSSHRGSADASFSTVDKILVYAGIIEEEPGCYACPANGWCEENMKLECFPRFEKVWRGGRMYSCRPDVEVYRQADQMLRRTMNLLEIRRGEVICGERDDNMMSIAELKSILDLEYGSKAVAVEILFTELLPKEESITLAPSTPFDLADMLGAAADRENAPFQAITSSKAYIPLTCQARLFLVENALSIIAVGLPMLAVIRYISKLRYRRLMRRLLTTILVENTHISAEGFAHGVTPSEVFYTVKAMGYSTDLQGVIDYLEELARTNPDIERWQSNSSSDVGYFHTPTAERLMQELNISKKDTSRTKRPSIVKRAINSFIGAN